MTAERRWSRRNIALAVLGVIACVAIALSVTIVWVHQVALNTDRYVAVVSRVATDPEVVEEVSGRLADQIVDQFEVPRLVEPLIRDWIQGKLADFMGTDLFLDGWAAANRAAHTALITVLRSDGVLDGERDRQITINALPAIIIGLERLQEIGIVPEDVDLPEPTDTVAASAIVERVASALEIELRPGFGEIPLVQVSKLEAARQWVRIFDWIAVGSVIIALGLVALTIWLARDRWRAVMLLALGAAGALVLAQVLVNAIGGAAFESLAAGGARDTFGAVAGALLGSLTTALTVVLLIGVGIAGAAMFYSRRVELVPADAMPPDAEPPPAEVPVADAPPPADPAAAEPAAPAKRTRRRTPKADPDA
jgi:hypothetical protein